MGPPSMEPWFPRLRELCDEIRVLTRRELRAALGRDAMEGLTRPASQGVGDVTFGLDLPGELAIERWFRAEAGRAALSVLTEDKGWRHLGPASRGGEPVPQGGFDHGGPRIAFDPVDGTRNLMADLRSAWTVVSIAGPGPGEPRFYELVGGIVSEIPTTRARSFRRYEATRGAGCRIEERLLECGESVGAGPVVADRDDRPDHGYFPFFRYDPALRPAIARLEADFFARLERHEDADLRSVWDDQYISNAGQLVLLASGIYRMIVDARALVGRRAGRPTVSSKPYDVAGAMLCALEAGAAITRADGGPLDFPIDAKTAIDMAGYANAATQARLEPHWLAALREAQCR